MCIIIDANCCHKFTGNHEDAKPVHKWIVDRGGKIATGGKNLVELRAAGLSDLIVEYLRAGKVLIYQSLRIEEQRKQLKGVPKCSNDEHIIFLARVSGSRLVFTKDNLLKKDLRNLSLVPKRNKCQVKIYDSKNDHKKLYSCPSCH